MEEVLWKGEGSLDNGGEQFDVAQEIEEAQRSEVLEIKQHGPDIRRADKANPSARPPTDL